VPVVSGIAAAGAQLELVSVVRLVLKYGQLVLKVIHGHKPFLDLFGPDL